MREEKLEIGSLQGIECPDGRNYQRLNCVDEHGNLVFIVLPTSKPCDMEKCTSDDCDLFAPVDIELDRKLVITWTV